MDIGLPKLSGIEAARKIRHRSPHLKIIFLSDNRDWDIAEEALSTGAAAYVVKRDAASELLPAAKTVLEGNLYISASLAGYPSHHIHQKQAVTPFRAEKKMRHEVEFYADDAEFVNGFARYIEIVLNAGNAIIVVATEPHHISLRQRLIADGLDVMGELKKGSYVPLELTSMMSSFMVNDSLDPILFRKSATDLLTGEVGDTRRWTRVAVCGEGVNSLLAEGNVEATIQLERLWDEIAQRHGVDSLCGYFRSAFAEGNSSMFEQVCSQHTGVRGRELRS
jgi:CheY-like chemotaxis protein